jgi:outer membrane protein assembly factor BamB
MFTRLASLHALVVVSFAAAAVAADWPQFRGPGGSGISQETGLPTTWSSTDNIVWQVELPGPGSSSPAVAGNRVYVTCYSGYGIEEAKGEQENLMRHVLCLDRRSGKILWQKEFKPKLPEHKYQGEGAYQGYAGSTPLVDGTRLYIFFGKSGVYCLDLDGNELWHATVGDRTNGWGSGASPIVYGKLLVINASVESGALVAFDKLTGEEVWQTKGISSAWNTPELVKAGDKNELVVSIQNNVVSFNPDSGKELWRCDGVHRYVCPSVVSHDGIVYAIGGGHTSLAVRAGGEGDVTDSRVVWRTTKGSNVGSPIYHEGHLYWAADGGGFVCCQNAETGETVFQERLEPRSGRIWSSPVLADGKLYIVSQHDGTFVVAAKPKFELLAHNKFEDDDSRTNASPAISDGQIFLRTDRKIYCIGKR